MAQTGKSNSSAVGERAEYGGDGGEREQANQSSKRADQGE